MRNLYSKLTELINKISFDEIYTGFTKCTFALFDDQFVYFSNDVIPYDNRFMGNTSIIYEGEHIAIWHIDNPEEVDIHILAADLVHEMFHAFQGKNGEKRYPSDLILLDYPDHLENYTVKHSENKLLAKVFQTEDLQEKKNFIAQFIAARRYREGFVRRDAEQEYFTETIEGMAEYAGCMALKQIFEAKYNERLNRYIHNLQMLSGQFFDIRKMSYYTGALFCLALQQAQIDFYHDLGETQTPLFKLVAKNAKALKPIIDFNETALYLELRQHLADKKQRIDEFLLSHNEEVAINANICGYDPMNMIKMDNRILCSRFVMLMINDNDKKNTSSEPLFLQGPVIVNLKQNSAYNVISYIK